MRVVQVPRRFVAQAWGGTETVIAETASRLPGLGWSTGIVCPAALSRPGPETVRGIPVERFGYFYPYWKLKPEARQRLDQVGGNLFSFSLFRRLLKLPGLELIHLHTGKRLGGIGRTAARLRHIPYVISLHGGALEVPGDEKAQYTEPTKGSLEWGKLLGWLVGSRRVLQEAGAIICVSPGERDILKQRYPQARVEFLPNGVDLERFSQGDGPGFRQKLGIPLERPLILTMGRLDPQKNQELGIRVLQGLLAAQVDCHLALIGPVTNQPYYERLQKLAAESASRRRVSILPGLDPDSGELSDAYQAADLMLLPSRHEPFGIVVLEAWAAGKPVAASKVGGLAHLIDQAETGLLFQPGQPAEAVSACQRILQAPELAAALGRAGRSKARQEYSWERVTGQLVNIYREVIDAHPVRKP